MDTTILASIIGAAATILTGILAVGITIWQIRKSQGDIIRDSYTKLLEERRSIMMFAIEDPVIRKYILNSFGFTKIPKAKEKLYFLTLLDIDHYQNVYYRYKRGLFPKELWPSWHVSMIGSFRSNLFSEIWASGFSDVISQEFKDYKEAGFPDI